MNYNSYTLLLQQWYNIIFILSHSFKLYNKRVYVSYINCDDGWLK